MSEQMPEKKETSIESTMPKFEKDVADLVTKKFPSNVEILSIQPKRIQLSTKSENIIEVAQFIRDELGFDHAESVTGLDHPDEGQIELVYHLGSYTDESLASQVLSISTRVPREEIPNPGNDSTKIASLREVFYSVEFHERECFEMLGIYFEGHPDNRRLLLPEDWADLPPLRRDFKIKGR
ncbi:MAG: NADH-ubiquinone oxidoreductase subunit C [Cenarchaeum symbiont of Oopsacas minuta]|nr:NADH-ubiquinone oxidoreductase subunit C [Cenarchaeum symbiont of Oopsacas minuta]